MRAKVSIGFILSIAVALFAQGDLSPEEWARTHPCPKGGSPSLNFKDRNYHCMSEWDPCTNTDWQNINWPTWPKYQDESYMTTPMWGESVTVPDAPIDGSWGALHCENDENGRKGLKPDWVVFDRELFAGDHPTTLGERADNRDKIVDLTGRLPTFSLYNWHTGVLRTFMLISQVDVPNENGYDHFYTEGVISGGDPKKNVKAGYGLLENGMSTGLPLSKASGANFSGWTSSIASTKTTNFWYIIDQVLPYNEWDNPQGDAVSYVATSTGAQLTKTDLFLNYNVSATLVQAIKLEGSMITEEKNSTTPPEGLFRSNSYSGAAGQLGSLGLGFLKSNSGQQAISGAFDGNGGDVNLSSTLSTVSQNIENMKFDDFGNIATLASIVGSGGTAAAGPIAASLVSNIFFGGQEKRYTWEESSINLSGTIETQDAGNRAEIPLSRQNTVKIPLIFKGDNGIVRDDIEVGLYSFRNSPKVHMKRVNYFIDIPIVGRQFIKSAYHITIEDPTCDLVLNKTNGNHFVSMKMMPVLWDSYQKKWSTMGAFTELRSPNDFINSTKWFDSNNGFYASSEFVSVGVEIAVQLAGEDKNGITPVLSQRVFAADLEYDGMNPLNVVVRDLDELNDPVYPQMESHLTCDVGYNYNTQGALIKNRVTESANLRATTFEINVVTGSEEFAGTNDPIYAEITTCQTDGTEKIWNYLLNIPNYDDFESGDDGHGNYKGTNDIYVFSEPGEIGPITKVKFKNIMPPTDEDRPGWLLSNFAVVQRSVLSGEEITNTGTIYANTWLAGIYYLGSLIYAEPYPNITFDKPIITYTYDIPNATTVCNDAKQRESKTSVMLFDIKAYTSPGVGRQLAINGQHFGRSTSAIQVFLGDQEASVIRVVPELVTAVVPNLAAGTYPIRIVKGGQSVSDPNVTLTVTGNTIPPVVTPTTPSFLSFDETVSSWHSGQATLNPDTVVHTGTTGSSLAIGADGYRLLQSPQFCASQLGTYGTTLALDVYIPASPSNVWWLGDVVLFVEAPSAGVYNSWQGNVMLTGLSTGAWHTVEIPLNAQALAALGGTSCDIEFRLVMNAATAGESYRFDNLHFTGSVLTPSPSTEIPPSSTGGTGSVFTCVAECLNATSVINPTTPMTLNTVGTAWYVMTQKPAGWQASEIAGRTIEVNGKVLIPGEAFPAAIDGKWYVFFSAGQHPWASWSYWL